MATQRSSFPLVKDFLFILLGIGVAFFCHDGNGKFLMQKRSVHARDEYGKWETGGGGIEFGHTVEDTLRKEIQEEYGTDVLEYEFLGYRDVHREHKGKSTHWIMIDFKVLVDPANVQIGEPDMCDEIGWFRLDALPDNIHSQIPRVLELYRDKLNQ